MSLKKGPKDGLFWYPEGKNSGGDSFGIDPVEKALLEISYHIDLSEKKPKLDITPYLVDFKKAL